jgi:hypothetical protein
MNKKCISIAWTGIAAILLSGGQTVHSVFKLPFDFDETSRCEIDFNSRLARDIKDSFAIIWDEAPMSPVRALEIIDYFLKTLMKSNESFGGKFVILGGDFRQVTPVVPHASVSQICENSIKRSRLWNEFEVFHLRTNMRTGKDEKEFAQWLLSLGDGLLKSDYDDDTIEIPSECLSNGNLIQEIYDQDGFELKDKCILCPKNEDTLELNEEILEYVNQNQTHTYSSIDSVESDELKNDQSKNNQSFYTLEFLNKLTPSGMPPHKLNLKISAIVMLLRNLDFKRGLCNGTRLVVRRLYSYIIEAEIISGSHVGNIELIPRIVLKSKGHELPFKQLRLQFPLRLAYCMTINKSQGQTFKKVGLFLSAPVFSHGQLYVAMSRVSRLRDLKVKIFESPYQGKLFNNRDQYFTKNVVFRELLI